VFICLKEVTNFYWHFIDWEIDIDENFNTVVGLLNEHYFQQKYLPTESQISPQTVIPNNLPNQ
jgi:hypothetical protein